jgi:hypothetical protein
MSLLVYRPRKEVCGPRLVLRPSPPAPVGLLGRGFMGILSRVLVLGAIMAVGAFVKRWQ